MMRRFGLRLFLVVAIALPGCGGGALPAALGNASGGAGAAAPLTSSADLLYVLHDVGQGSHRHGVVTAVQLPRGQRVARLQGLNAPNGLCADTSGNVWVVDRESGRWYAFEFAHGGVKAIAHVMLPKKAFGGTCAVDATTGNLAVANDDSAVRGSFYVFPGAKSGTPLVYRVPFEPLYASYDGSGDLFADGIVGSTAFFVFAELPGGGKRFKRIDLHEPTGFPGGLQWDGQYLALQTSRKHAVIYRLQVTDSGVRVDQTVHFTRMSAQTSISIVDGVVVAQSLHYDRAAVWPYPGGGRPSGSEGNFDELRGMTISI
jgi:hypothetical protein